ncbi:MAG: hypothetical protein KGL57_11360 [Burkholderiales bacterium]|nr:hypothetical protein [Burkholderiales bacterium]
MNHRLIALAGMLSLALLASGCTVISVVDTAASVAVSAVKVTAKVAETAVDVTAAGVKAATSSKEEPPTPAPQPTE